MSVTNDNIGNRKQFTQDSETTSYSANELNQYSAITNNGNPVVTAFDLDGNMITNGDWAYTWNGENRMISASNGSTVVSYNYDYMGRCFSKVKNGSETKYIWDGYNIICESKVNGLESNVSYNVWGLDLSQSMQGAGGVGGLLAVVQNGTAYYPCYDGNGNVTDYVDGSGAVVAHYEYSPFGGITVASESKADDFTHRFSTKPWDGDTGIIHYEFRDYIVELAVWGSRDALGEGGGFNLYGFVGNEPIVVWDYLGLKWLPEEHRGDEFYHMYFWGFTKNVNVTTPRGWYPSKSLVQKFYFRGGTGDVDPNKSKEVKPEIVATDALGKANCYCVKKGTGTYSIQVFWYGIKPGIPTFNDLTDEQKKEVQQARAAGYDVAIASSSIMMTKETADYGNWHEKTEVQLLKRLHDNTIAIAESRAAEYSCDNPSLKPISKEQLEAYIRWDKAVAAFFAQTRGVTAFDKKFAPTIQTIDGKLQFAPVTPKEQFRIEDFDEWYKPDIWGD